MLIITFLISEYVNHNFFDKLLPLQEQDFLYLGVGNPERDAKQNWFNGCISTFAVYNEVLDDKLCKQITSNINSSLFKFKDSEFLRLYYDMKFTDENKVIDLSGNGNDGYSSNTNQVDTQYTTETLRRLYLYHLEKKVNLKFYHIVKMDIKTVTG